MRFLAPSGPADELTFAELNAEIDRIARHLLRFPPGSRVLLIFRPGLAFVAAFVACLRAGIVAVPLRLPSPRAPPDRIAAVIGDCAPAAVLTERDSGALARHAGNCPVLDVAELDAASPGPTPLRRDVETALLQYTSGSTGDPKGVVIRHDHLASNIATLIERLAIDSASPTVSWLPHYHDMGLVGPILTALVSGKPAILMAPADFLRDPLAWLRAISTYRADISMAPNFAYDLCARRLQEDPGALDPLAIDLSPWRVAIVGGEPVNAGTLARFAAAAAPCGFAAQAFYPCYGLAEATLFVDGVQGPLSRLARRFDAAALRRGRAVASDSTTATTLVACGARGAAGAATTVIADPSGATPLADGEVGEIWIAGPSIADGYWERRQADERFGNRLADHPGRRFLRTGDRGFFADDLLFVTGRDDDVIIVNGLNHYPQDLEDRAGAAHSALARWRAAAFAVDGAAAPRIVVMQEVARSRVAATPEALVAAVRQAVSDSHDVALDDVVLLAPGKLPLTSSGKVRRAACRALYQGGDLDRLRWPGAGGREHALATATPARPPPGQGDLDAIEQLRAIVGEVLARPAAGVDARLPLSAFPVDSLKLVEILLLIEARLGRRLAPDHLLGAGSLAALAAELSLLAAAEATVPPGTFWADAALPADIVPPPAGAGPGEILVTGATGLLGRHVVAELLKRPGGLIHCLARTASAETVAAPGSSACRLNYVAADLATGSAGFAALDDRIGTIIHCAADMDLVSPYPLLRPPNVIGTRAVLRFAATGRAKRILHVSSVSVLETPVKAGRRLGEREPLDYPETLAGGYAQSKWVADVMMVRARERGFRASICRPPWILADRPAAAVPDGFLRRFLAACAGLGQVPDTPFRLNVVPVDFVARAIAALAIGEENDEPVYHLGAEDGIDMAAIAGILRRDGSDIGLLAVDRWIEQLRQAVRTIEDHPLRPFAALFLGSGTAPGPAINYLAGRIPEMDSARTGAVLRRLGVAGPPAIETVRDLVAETWTNR